MCPNKKHLRETNILIIFRIFVILKKNYHPLMKSACRYIFVLSLVLPVVMNLAGCGGEKSYRTMQGGVWNTTYNITYRADRDLSDSVLAVMRHVELSLSPFCDSSLITRINRGEDIGADSLLRRIFTASLHVNAESNGAFDPTVAPLVNLWGFGYRNSGTEPSQEMIDSIMPLVGIASCSIDSAGHILKKSLGTEFNFSAITKGYGCDLVGEMLRRNGCEDYMVEIGGEIALAGRNPRGDKWHIMVDAPIENDTAVVHERMTVIAVSDAGVATSGNYRNFKTTASGRIWHTISPVTGRPAHTDLLSATVIAPNTMLADAYATSCMAMNCTEALAMLERIEGVEGLLITLNPADSTFISTTTKGFPKALR